MKKIILLIAIIMFMFSNWSVAGTLTIIKPKPKPKPHIQHTYMVTIIKNNHLIAKAPLKVLYKNTSLKLKNLNQFNVPFNFDYIGITQGFTYRKSCSVYNNDKPIINNGYSYTGLIVSLLEINKIPTLYINFKHPMKNHMETFTYQNCVIQLPKVWSSVITEKLIVGKTYYFDIPVYPETEHELSDMNHYSVTVSKL